MYAAKMVTVRRETKKDWKDRYMGCYAMKSKKPEMEVESEGHEVE